MLKKGKLRRKGRTQSREPKSEKIGLSGCRMASGRTHSFAERVGWFLREVLEFNIPHAALKK